MWKNKQNRANMKQSIQNSTICPRRDENDTKQNENNKTNEYSSTNEVFFSTVTI